MVVISISGAASGDLVNLPVKRRGERKSDWRSRLLTFPLSGIRGLGQEKKKERLFRTERRRETDRKNLWSPALFVASSDEKSDRIGGSLPPFTFPAKKNQKYLPFRTASENFSSQVFKHWHLAVYRRFCSGRKSPYSTLRGFYLRRSRQVKGRKVLLFFLLLLG